MMPKSSMVQFRASGVMFEVLREPTLSLHPDSLLAQMAENWDEKEPIVAEADAGMFAYILEFLRHRKVCLPTSVSKKGLLQTAAKLSVNISSEQIDQAVPLRDIAAAAEKVSRHLSQSKGDVVSDLIVMVALVKAAAGASSFVVNLQDVSQFAQTGKDMQNVAASYPFLFQGTSVKLLQDRFTVWGKQNGFAVTVMAIAASQLEVKFEPPSEEAVSEST